jgi:transposase
MQSEVERDLLEKNKYLHHEVARLQHIIMLFQKDKFGSRSEKLTELAPDQLLFNEIELEARLNPPEPEQTELIEGYTRKSAGRGAKKPFPAHLPREEVVIDLSDAEKICPKDGAELKQIGEDVCEKLKVVPAQVTVVVERKKKYACPCCESHLAQAKSNSILPGTIATVELISFLIFSKFFQGLPLYRLEELFKLQGIDLKRGTMAGWLIKTSEKLQSIWNILEEWAFATKYLGIDATSLQVLKEDGRRPEEKSSMWARGSPELGIVLFDYDISNAGHVAERLIAGFSGTLQADAHPGYHRLDKSVWRLGCMMHSRRKFFEAYVGAKKQPGLAHDGMQMIKKIYKLEEAYRDQNLTFDERYEARLRELKPQMEKMLSWCEAKKPKILPSSPIGIAINYYINEYDELVGFLADGKYEIDNGWIERAIRKYAIGRNNWLFCDTVDGAKASSLYYSLVVTAKLNGKNPFDVITEILKSLPFAKTIDDFEKLAALLVNKPVLN